MFKSDLSEMRTKALVLGLGALVSMSMNLEVSAQASWRTDAPYYGQKYTTLPGARGLLLDEAGDILAVSRNTSTITAIYETTNGAGGTNVCQVVIVSGAPTVLNHGIAYSKGYLYASSRTTVYRFPYTPGQRRLISQPPQVVINNIPSPGHETRTLIFDSEGRLYVSVGSGTDVDPNSQRARIRRFTIGSLLPIDFSSGEIFADGLRNNVGLGFDKRGVLWGVDNGAEMLSRPDLGGDIHNGNPAEELNKFDLPVGAHYGYPYCFTAGVLPGYDAGTQFAWPTFMNDSVHTDAWCRDTKNNQGPIYPMPAHTAPLDIEFYNGKNCSTSVGAFPCDHEGDAFITFHGSWNSDVKVGYQVKRYVYNKVSLHPTGQSINIIYEPNTANCANCFRPVDGTFDGKGHLIISDDNNGEIFRIYYGTPPPQVGQGCSVESKALMLRTRNSYIYWILFAFILHAW